MNRVLIALLLAGLLGLGAGCGAKEQSALDRVPALSARLAGIDDAVADRRYRAAREGIDDLVEVTVAARDAGDLDAAAADRILAAAAQLLSALPAQVATPSPTPSAAPTTRAPAPKPKPEPKKKPGGKGKGDDRGDREDRDDEDDD